MALKLDFISDTHGMHSKLTLSGGDALFHTGDMTGRGSLHETFGFLEWFGHQPYPIKVLIAGNHDKPFANESAYAVEAECRAQGITYLRDSEATLHIGGQPIRVYGSPWTPTFHRWHFMKDRGRELAEVWSQIPEGLDILLTHGPAFGYGDAVFHSGDKVGCRELDKALSRARPKIHAYGHIHEGRGWGEHPSGALLINASTLDEDYAQVRPPISVGYDPTLKAVEAVSGAKSWID